MDIVANSCSESGSNTDALGSVSSGGTQVDDTALKDKKIADGSSSNDILFKEIVDEIFEVLNASAVTVTDSIVKGQGRQPGPLQHKQSNELSVQTVFLLLDTFVAWSTAAKQQLAANAKQLQQKHSSAAGTGTTAGVAAAAGLGLEGMLRAMGRVLDAIPKELLGIAAMSVNAFARAIRYIELDARESHLKIETKPTAMYETVKLILCIVFIFTLLFLIHNLLIIS